MYDTPHIANLAFWINAITSVTGGDTGAGKGWGEWGPEMCDILSPTLSRVMWCAEQERLAEKPSWRP